MLQFLTVLLRGVIATFAGLLVAGGTLTLAADHTPVDRPTLVPVSPEPATLTVPDVTGQAYVFAKGILQDRGFAWRVTGRVMGYAANRVATQQPSAGTIVLDNGAPTVTLTLLKNQAYAEHGMPENTAPYRGTAIRIATTAEERPQTSVAPRIEPVQVPASAHQTLTVPVLAPTTPTPVTPATTTTPLVPAATVPSIATTPTVTTAPAPVTTPAPAPATSSAGGPRTPDFTVPGAPKEPVHAASLPDRVAALSAFVEGHHDPSPANLNHWLYEHAYVVAGARFGWWHGAEALQALIAVDKRAETLWGVGSQSRTVAEQALSEVRAQGS